MSQTLIPLIQMGAWEAHAHRFVESKNRHCDLGGRGFYEYFTHHWPTFSRYRWVEHLEGAHEHVCYKRPGSFGVLHPDRHKHCPRALELVKTLFLGTGSDRRMWELLDFAIRKDQLQQAGFDYDQQIFPILCDFGLNDWRLCWTNYYRIVDDRLEILVNG